MARMTPQQLDTLRTEATATVDTWNTRHRVGQRVEYQSHPEAAVKLTKTRSPAFTVESTEHVMPCCVLQRIGLAALRHCKPIEASAAAELAALTGHHNPYHARRERLRNNLVTMARQVELIRLRMHRAADAIGEDSPVEFLLDVKQIGRDLDALASACRDIHYSEEPK
jgi:hypothetical protein